MSPLFAHAGESPTTPVWPVAKAELESWLAKLPDSVATWVNANDFKGQPGRVLKTPSPSGEVSGIAFGLGDGDDPLLWRALPDQLNPGIYRIEGSLDAGAKYYAALGWALGCYRFERYKQKPKTDALPRVVLPEGVDGAEVSRIVRGIFLARDLINTPSSDMGPQELTDATQTLAAQFGADLRVLIGDELIAHNYPMIFAVGKASPRAPRLLDLTWGDANAPKVTLVGKGVVFDSGGLDLKPSPSMLMMKKDMGGAANVLGLAHMIMDSGLKLRLRVLIPIAENSVSGDSYRPGDILHSRKGLTVEIGNTDAEGRLLLADALAEADLEQPELLFDLATLTGAARTAMGADIPPFFTPDDGLAASLAKYAVSQSDPLWRLPLWKPYDKGLESRVADLNNVTEGGMAGAITAALFLQRFVTATQTWAHFDIYAWNAKGSPGQPIGGEAMAIRALYALLRDRYK